MHLLVAGSSGFLGRAATRRWTEAGHRVTRLVRRPPDGPDQIRWDPASGALDQAVTERLGEPEGFDAVVNLAGSPIARRWTPDVRRALRSSRVDTTATLCRAIAAGNHPVPYVSQSGVGGYGEDCGDRLLTEDSPLGAGFLADLVRDWEGAAEPARAAGARVVQLRCGIVLDAQAPAYRLMSLPFRLGLGGRLGSGRQFMPMVTLADWLGVLDHALGSERLSGGVNVSLPEPVRNRDFTRELARALHRPALLVVPGPVLRLLLDGFAWELLGSCRAVPEALQNDGFEFSNPDVTSVVAAITGR